LSAKEATLDELAATERTQHDQQASAQLCAARRGYALCATQVGSKQQRVSERAAQRAAELARRPSHAERNAKG
jgi:hypothetical protein